MKKKIKGKLGTFSNDGFGMGVVEFDKATMKNMQKIVAEDLSKIKKDFTKNLKRLKKIIINEIGSYPKEEDFIKWFFNKKKIYEWGSNLPKITDDEIFQQALIYTNESKKKIKDISKKGKELTTSIILEEASYSLENLVFRFSEEVFKSNTSKEDIECVFSYPFKKPKSSLNLNISNKKFVFLLEEMKNANIIISNNLFRLIEQSKCFKSTKSTILTGNNLDQAKSQLKKTPLASDVESAIKQLVKNIKKY